MQIDVIMVLFGAEPWLATSADRVLTSVDVSARLILVDNGCTDTSTLKELANSERVTVVGNGENLGFAAGNNLGAMHSDAPVICLINADALVESDALSKLAARAMQDGVGISTASLRLGDDPSKINSAGNPVHFLGLSWAGAFEEDATNHSVAKPVAAASGAAMAVRRSVWEQIGGFEERFFMYVEDTDLSTRCWQAGHGVMFEPDAKVIHQYEFGRNTNKFYLLERNRLIYVLTTTGSRTLLLLLPVLLGFEVGMLFVSLAQGWAPAKIKGWGWLLRNAGWVLRRRRTLSGSRVVKDRALAPLITGRFDAQNSPLPRVLAPLDAILGWYWRIIRRLL